MLLKSERLKGLLGGTFFEWLGVDLLSRLEMLGLAMHKDWAKLKLLRRARRQRRTLVTNFEAFFIHSLASGLINVPGDFVEVGVYQGVTARLICQARGHRAADKTVHLCDTFEGLPEPAEFEKKTQAKNRFACGLEAVARFLADCENVQYHRGFCPDSVRGKLDDHRFAFVHLDIDLYQGTLDCLKYFFPRMSPGGVILSHDYSICIGVQKAFTEFAQGTTEQVIELPTTQCMLIKSSAVDVPVESAREVREPVGVCSLGPRS